MALYDVGWSPTFLVDYITEWQETNHFYRCQANWVDLSDRFSAATATKDDLRWIGIIRHRMRSFCIVTYENEPINDASVGFQCKRQMLRISRSDEDLQLYEKRYSTTLNLFPLQRPCGKFTLLSMADNIGFSAWKNTLGNQTAIGARDVPWEKYGILPAGLYTGFSAFQIQLCAFIDCWETDWSRTIASIDDIVSVKVRNLCLAIHNVRARDLH